MAFLLTTVSCFHNELTASSFDFDAELDSLDNDRLQADQQLQAYKNSSDRYDRDGSQLRLAQGHTEAAKKNAIMAIKQSMKDKLDALKSIEDSRDSAREKFVNFTIAEADIINMASQIAKLKAEADQSGELKVLVAELDRNYDALLRETGVMKKALEKAGA